jgi:hypothetical protein
MITCQAVSAAAIRTFRDVGEPNPSMSREHPWRTCMCSACGREWFREASYYAFFPEEGLRSWDTWPDLTGQACWIPMTVGACLCGTPLDPLISSLRWGIHR